MATVNASATLSPRHEPPIARFNPQWKNRAVAIIPFPALGDITIYLRLAQSFIRSGSSVTIYSDALFPAADLASWIDIRPISTQAIDEIARSHDLVIGDILAKPVREYDGVAENLSSLSNFIAVNAKALPKRQRQLSTPAWLSGTLRETPHRPFYQNQRCGLSMVACIDIYAKEVLGLQVADTPPRIARPCDWEADEHAGRRILIFPTTPNPKKNYHLQGFKRLYDLLEKNGWKAEIVCMPHEIPAISAVFETRTILTFSNLRALILHIFQSKAVISNDSGGGHLASMLGIPTFTITKKREDFVWRPGFNRYGHVISPTVTFKWISGRVWRPFIRLRRIIQALAHL